MLLLCPIIPVLFMGSLHRLIARLMDSLDRLKIQLTESDTVVKGEKSNPVARPVGEGVYSLVRHHTATRTSTWSRKWRILGRTKNTNLRNCVTRDLIF